MQQLLYAPEVRNITEIDIPDAPVKDQELELAKQLIAQISSDSFDPTEYEDDVKKRIETAVQKKVEGKEIEVSPSAPESGAQVIDLMEALRASVSKGGRRGQAAAPAAEEAQTQRKPPKKVAVAAAPRVKAAKR